MTRPPDFYVLTESGHRIPALLWGALDEGLLLGKTGEGSPFLIDPQALCLVTFAGTALDIQVEPAEPPTGVWLAMTEQTDDPTDWPEYPEILRGR